VWIREVKGPKGHPVGSKGLAAIAIGSIVAGNVRKK